MYIEFQLPDSRDGYYPDLVIRCINHDISSWVRKHNIEYYKTKIHKNTYRLCLKSDKDYSYFGLTWDPEYNVSKSFKFKQPK